MRVGDCSMARRAGRSKRALTSALTTIVGQSTSCSVAGQAGYAARPTGSKAVQQGCSTRKRFRSSTWLTTTQPPDCGRARGRLAAVNLGWLCRHLRPHPQHRGEEYTDSKTALKRSLAERYGEIRSGTGDAARASAAPPPREASSASTSARSRGRVAHGAEHPLGLGQRPTRAPHQAVDERATVPSSSASGTARLTSPGSRPPSPPASCPPPGTPRRAPGGRAGGPTARPRRRAARRSALPRSRCGRCPRRWPRHSRRRAPLARRQHDRPPGPRRACRGPGSCGRRRRSSAPPGQGRPGPPSRWARSRSLLGRARRRGPPGEKLWAGLLRGNRPHPPGHP